MCVLGIDLSTVPNQPKDVTPEAVTPEAVSLPESSNIEVVSNSVPIVDEINSAVSTDGKGSLNALVSYKLF